MSVNVIRNEQAPEFKCIGPSPLGEERDGVRWCVGAKCLAWCKVTTYLGDIGHFMKTDETLDALFARCSLGCCRFSGPTEDDLKRPGVSYAD